MFSFFRKHSSACSSRSHHGHHNSKSQAIKLDCGHTLSTLAIQVHVQEALAKGKETVPNCCGIALPHTLLHAIVSKPGADLPVGGRGLPSPDLGSLPDSAYGENSISSIDLPRSSECSPSPVTTPVAPNAGPRRTRHQEIKVDSALANEASANFKAEQKEQFERVAMFECSQWKALAAHHQSTLQQLTAQHEASRKERIEQHAQDLEHLEERQIGAEHDLRQAHEQETQNVATALKHMYAYCLGTNATHPDHPHVVSEEDFKKLDHQRLLQANLPRKHENAINVLRARQEREMQRRIEKQEAELDALDAAHQRETMAEQKRQKEELERLHAVIDARRKRLLQRWDLRFEVWKRDYEAQHATTLTHKWEHEPWPARKADHVLHVPETSVLARYLKAEA